jgi:fibronectin type 3 domain-containing protein
MNQINYAQMSDEELRQYFLRHRDDKTALKAYLDRLGEQQQDMITTVDDPDFEAKIQAAVNKKIERQT